MTLSEKNQIYDLLKQVTAIVEESQRQLPTTEDGDREWNQLQIFIEDTDDLYHEVENMN